MKLWSVEGNRQRLDGGAMFGNVPKALWSRWFAADASNRIELACRALLVEEDGGRVVLFETGIGAFFEPKMKERFGVHQQSHILIENLAGFGFQPEDIDIIVLSHLHFDHAGGLLTAWSETEPFNLIFPKAQVLVGRESWLRAINPHFRDRASFIPDLHALLEKSGRLNLVDGATSDVLGHGYRFHYSEGHTPGLMLTEISTTSGPIVFAGDLIPGVPWVHLPITMGYDRFPERLIDEKQDLLTELVARDGSLFFTHDPETAIARIVRHDNGRFGVSQTQDDQMTVGIEV